MRFAQSVGNFVRFVLSGFSNRREFLDKVWEGRLLKSFSPVLSITLIYELPHGRSRHVYGRLLSKMILLRKTIPISFREIDRRLVVTTTFPSDICIFNNYKLHFDSID